MSYFLHLQYTVLHVRLYDGMFEKCVRTPRESNSVRQIQMSLVRNANFKSWALRSAVRKK